MEAQRCWGWRKGRKNGEIGRSGDDKTPEAWMRGLASGGILVYICGVFKLFGIQFAREGEVKTILSKCNSLPSQLCPGRIDLCWKRAQRWLVMIKSRAEDRWVS